MVHARDSRFNERMTPFSPTLPNARSIASLLPTSHAAGGPLPPAFDQSVRWPVSVLGVPFAPLTQREAVARIGEMIASRQPHQVVTANVDFLVRARHDVELRRILLEADLVLCDGAPVRWASHMLGNPLPERVAGADLVPALLDAAEVKGHRVFLLGAAEGVAARAAANIAKRWPAVKLVGHHSPPFADLLQMDHEEILRLVRTAQPDLLLVSFGCPKQEKWISMHLHSLGVPVVIGVGATIDFLAGRVRRAPTWMQRCGAEWAFRLLQEPARLHRRYRSNLREFFPAIAAQVRRLHTTPPRGSVPCAPTLRYQPGLLEVRAGTDFTRRGLERHQRFWRTTAPFTQTCVLDGSDVVAIDATGAAFLADWRRRIRAAGGRLVLLTPSPVLREALHVLGLLDLFPAAASAVEAQQWASGVRDEPSVSCDPDAGFVRWHGEIHALNARDVWRMTLQYLFALGVRRPAVVIDLSDVRFVDSAAASVMLRLKEAARGQFGYDALFIGARPAVRNVLRFAGAAGQLLPPS